MGQFHAGDGKTYSIAKNVPREIISLLQVMLTLIQAGTALKSPALVENFWSMA